MSAVSTDGLCSIWLRVSFTRISCSSTSIVLDRDRRDQHGLAADPVAGVDHQVRGRSTTDRRGNRRRGRSHRRSRAGENPSACLSCEAYASFALVEHPKLARILPDCRSKRLATSSSTPSRHATLSDMPEATNLDLPGRAALTTLSDDERLFRDSVYEFADREIRPLVREMDEHAQIPRALIDKLFALGVMGIEIPESLGRRRRQLLPRRARRRSAVARRSVGRRARRRPEHARRQRAAPLGQRRSEAALPAAARVGVGRRVRAVGGRVRQRRVRDGDARDAARRRRRLGRSPAASSGSPTRSKRISSSSSPTPIPPRATAASRRSSSSAGSSGFTVGQEGRQARHSRQQHVRADARGLPRSAPRTCSARSARATRSRSRR